MRTVAGSLRGLDREALPPDVRDDILAAFRDLRR